MNKIHKQLTPEERIYSLYKDILNRLMKHRNAHYFFKPLSAQPAWGSDERPPAGLRSSKTSEGMSFLQVQEKIDKKAYASPQDFVSDLMMIWRTAKLYKDPQDEIHQTANELSKLSETLLALLPYAYNDQERDSGLKRYVELRINRYLLLKPDHV